MSHARWRTLLRASGLAKIEADSFNAVTIDGMRVNATDSGGITRRVPLDVVSSEVADQIEVTKALRPDQDADSIGGAVNIARLARELPLSLIRHPLEGVEASNAKAAKL